MDPATALLLLRIIDGLLLIAEKWPAVSEELKEIADEAHAITDGTKTVTSADIVALNARIDAKLERLRNASR